MSAIKLTVHRLEQNGVCSLTGKEGEILVVSTTDPAWTPLFLTAGGLVSETGAIMAHGPTVAREYGIPAVISVAGATTRIITGQVITVDGAAGIVSPA